MARTDKRESIDITEEQMFQVRETALSLAGNQEVNIDDVFFMDNLSEVETNIKKLNEYSDKCWILSAILLYSLVYDKSMYSQSGLSWQEYVAESKKRLGLSRDDISRQLSSARFFIKHNQALKRAGWNPIGSSFKLASAELALELSGSLDETIQHLVNDSWREFKDWYSSFKQLPPAITTTVVDKRPDIVISNHTVTINQKPIVTYSEDLPSAEKDLLESYIEQIYTIIKHGDTPAIIGCYDDKETKTLKRLLDKNRQGR